MSEPFSHSKPSAGAGFGRFSRVVLMLAAGIGLWAGAAHALDCAAGDNVSLSDGQVISGDWYAAGKSINLSGRVDRGAYLAARQVVVSGEIGQDLNILAETVQVNSAVDGSAHIGARQIRIASPLSGDALLAAQDLTLESGSRVGEDLYAAAYTITLDGSVKGKAGLAAETVNVNGTIAGDVNIRAHHLNVGPKARILGSLTYSAPEEMKVSPDAQVPRNVTWHKTEMQEQKKTFAGLAVLAGIWVLFRLGMVVAGLVIGIVLIALFPVFSRRFVQGIHDQPWLSLGWGLVTLICAPAALVIVALTLLGIPLAVLLALLFVLAVLVARIAAGYLIGVVILGENSKRQPIFAFVIGTLIFAVLSFIPFLGFLVKLAGTLLGLGAWWLLGTQPAPAKGMRPALKKGK